MLMIGSQAMYMNRGPCNDIDIIATPYELEVYKAEIGSDLVLAKPSKRGATLFVQGSLPIEVDTSITGQLLLDIVAGHKELVSWKWSALPGSAMKLDNAGPEVLYALKNSHKYLKDSKFFLKTMRDIQYLNSLGYVKIHPTLKDWFKIREKETYDYSHPNLNQGKNNFFTSNFDYRYEHDTLHEAVKLYEVPAFNLIKKDLAEVFCSKEKFYEVAEEIRLATVYEESATLALERAMIPSDFKSDPYKSFTKSLEKVCTSISSGWWREYAWENYFQVLDMYNENYVERFKTALANGVIKPYEN